MVRVSWAFFRIVSCTFLLSTMLLFIFVGQRALPSRSEEREVMKRRIRRANTHHHAFHPTKTSELLRSSVYNHRRLQAERRTRLQQTCSAMGLDPGFNISSQLNRTLLKQMDFLLIVPELRLVYCYVPKASCTSWKRLLLTLVGYSCFQNVSCREDAHILARKRFTRMSKLSLSSAKEIFASHTTFFFTRNPYTRVLSAYLEKVLYHPESKIQYELTEWFAANHPNLRPKSSDPFTFKEFLMHYIAEKDKNQHWEDMHKLCLPCYVNYDFIGKFETLKPDSDFILDVADADKNIRFPKPQKKPTYSSDDTTLKKFYSQLSDDDMQQLSVSRGFATDMTMFGYQIPDSIRRN